MQVRGFPNPPPVHGTHQGGQGELFPWSRLYRRRQASQYESHWLGNLYNYSSRVEEGHDVGRARGSTFPDVDMPPAHRLAFRAKARFADFEKRSWKIQESRHVNYVSRPSYVEYLLSNFAK